MRRGQHRGDGYEEEYEGDLKRTMRAMPTNPIARPKRPQTWPPQAAATKFVDFDHDNSSGGNEGPP